MNTAFRRKAKIESHVTAYGTNRPIAAQIGRGDVRSGEGCPAAARAFMHLRDWSGTADVEAM
jgi:hypothetical protein